MNSIIKQLKKQARNTRLSSAEKNEMKNSLLQYVVAHPVSPEVLATRGIPSPFMFGSFRNKKTISALVIGSLLVGSSVSFAAEGSVPGDILYPVKVGVNENVRKAVAVTPEAKAALGVELLNRRLVEVEKLAANPTAPVELQQKAAETLKKYAHDVEESLETEENDNDGDEAISIATNVSAVLNTHEHILSEIHSDIVRDNNEGAAATSSVNAVAPRVAVASTTTRVLPVEHSRNAEPIKIALENVRASIKDVEVKSEELKKKYATSTADSQVPSISIPATTNNNSDYHNKEKVGSRTPSSVVVATSTQVTIPSPVHIDEHRAVIENHQDNSPSTAPAQAEQGKVVKSEEQKTQPVNIESHTTTTSTSEWHKKEDSHTETSRVATSTSEHN